MMQKLPHGASAQVDEKKILYYLLNLSHPDGQSKARFFLARGFRLDAWDVFRAALISQGQNNTVTKVVENAWGTRYQVDCHCPTPDGANPCIRSVWQLEAGEAAPRLLTAYPLSN